MGAARLASTIRATPVIVPLPLILLCDIKETRKAYLRVSSEHSGLPVNASTGRDGPMRPTIDGSLPLSLHYERRMHGNYTIN